MLLGICLISANLLAWVVVASRTRPAPDDRSRQRDVVASRTGPAFDDRSRQHDQGRRMRQLRQSPDRVTFLDVENLLFSSSTPPTVVARVMNRAASRRVTARTMWRWGTLHGSRSLVAVVDAGLAEDSLLDHLDAGTAPDLRTLEVFAQLSADPETDELDLGADPDADDLSSVDLVTWSTPPAEPHELRRFDKLPPITGPGLPPIRPSVEWDLDGSGDWRGLA